MAIHGGLFVVPLLLLGAGAVLAQDPAPEVDWLGGKPVPLAGEAAPGWRLIWFGSHRLLAGHAEHLRTWFGGDKPALQVVLLTERAVKPEQVKALAPLRIAVDPGQVADSDETLAGQGHVMTLVAPDGGVAWVGSIGEGIREVAKLANGTKAAGPPRSDSAGHCLVVIQDGVEAFDDTADALAHPRRWLAEEPHNGLAQGLFCLVQHECVCDAQAAAAAVAAALTALAGDSAALGSFADLLLRSHRPDAGHARLLLPHLQTASAQAPNDRVLQVATVRALLLAGEHREAGRRVPRLIAAFADDMVALQDLLSALLLDSTPAAQQAHAELILARLEALHGNALPAEQAVPAWLLAARYTVQRQCSNDAAGAAATLATYISTYGEAMTLNNAAWYLATQTPTKQRQHLLALGMAEKMLENRDQLGDFELDTVGTVMFSNGRFAEAVAAQKAAVEKSGNNPEYAHRLQRFEKFAARVAARK